MVKTVEYQKGEGNAMAVDPVDPGDSYRGEKRDPDRLTIEPRQWE